MFTIIGYLIDLIWMIEHIVLFKWKSDASAEAITGVIENLKALKNQIPGIVDLSCGKNFSERGRGFEYALVVRFEDRAALESYAPHPLHQEVVQNFVKPILDDIIAVDYEI